jgi:hypothetical protein
MEPDSSQSVPSAMVTPICRYAGTMAVSPYSERLERGDQMRSVPLVAMVPISSAVTEMPWMIAVCRRRRSLPPLAEVETQRNSLRADSSMPSPT